MSGLPQPWQEIVFAVYNDTLGGEEGCSKYPAGYSSCFEDDEGDALLFFYDDDTDTGTLRMSDDWGHIYTVIDGRAVGIDLPEAEAQWLQLSWNAAVKSKEWRLSWMEASEEDSDGEDDGE